MPGTLEVPGVLGGVDGVVADGGVLSAGPIGLEPDPEAGGETSLG